MEDSDILALLDQVTQTLVNSQNRLDGGWGAGIGGQAATQESDCWSTAEAVLWFEQYDPTKYRDQIDRGLRFLAQTQKTEENVDPTETDVDGGWGSRPDRPSDPTATALGLLACARAARVGYNIGPSVSKARDWLISHINPDGGWSLLSQPHSSAFNTCWSCFALKECADVPSLADVRIKASLLPRALRLVEGSQRAGGWGNALKEGSDPIATAYCVFLLASMGRSEQAHPGIMYLLNKQGYSGGWDPGAAQSPIEAAAWATKALLSIPSIRGEARPVKAIDSGLQYLRSMYVPDLGWPAEPGEEPTLWATYYASLALLSQVDARREDEGVGGIIRSRHGRRVFIVHGHHAALKEDVKQIVTELGFQAVVLQDMPDQGAITIMDKFEYYAQQEGVDFAVVIATPDGIDATENTPIPRGNVLAELGWFIGKLGRNRVCIVRDPAATLPSDFGGVTFINPRDKNWKNELRAQLRLFEQMQDPGSTKQGND